MVIISHGYGYVSQYAHCQKTLVETGEQIKKGQKIATCGATGNTTGSHLHFGVAKDGKWVDPLSVLK
jgi:murein DD-endopeptidase MepM/ murein hydrolase activator NlpD